MASGRYFQVGGEPGGPYGLAGRPAAISSWVAQGSPVNVKFVLEIASGGPFRAGGPPGGPYGLARPPDAISGQMAQGSPAAHR